MNIYKNVITVLMILLFSTLNVFYSFGSPENSKDEQRMQEYLKRYPLPENNVKLKCKASFPTETQIDQDIYLKDVYSIAIDRSSNQIYVTDNVDHKILNFDLNGNFLKQIGHKGQGPGELFRPMDIMLWKDYIVVNDVGNLRVQFLDRNGKYIKSFRTFKSYFAMTMNQDGQLYCVNTSNYMDTHLVDVLNSEGKLLFSFGEKLKYHPNDVGIFQIRLFVDQSDCIYLAYTSFAVIQKYTKKGELIWETKLDHPFMNDRVAEYKKQLKSSSHSNKYKICFNDFLIDDEKIFTARFFPRFEIDEFDLSGKLKKVFWTDEFKKYLLLDFCIKKENEKYIFYVARALPDRQIDIFTY